MELYIIKQRFAIHGCDYHNEWVWVFQDFAKARKYFCNLVSDYKNKEHYKQNLEQCIFSSDDSISVLQFDRVGFPQYVVFTFSPLNTVD